MSTWTRPICAVCWSEFIGTEPITLSEPEQETCSFCQQPTRSGIYVRARPGSKPYLEGQSSD